MLCFSQFAQELVVETKEYSDGTLARLMCLFLKPSDVIAVLTNIVHTGSTLCSEVRMRVFLNILFPRVQI